MNSKIWERAAARQNQQNDLCAQQRLESAGHPPRLIRVFAVHMKKPWDLRYLMSGQQRLWSDWVDAQADLSSLGAQEEEQVRRVSGDN